MLSHVCLLCELDLSELLSVGHHVLVLDTHNTAAPVSSEVLVIVELSAEVLGKEFKILVVFLADFGECDTSSCLVVDELSKAGLTLDEGIGNTLLSAECWQEDHKLEWINVVGNNDELGLTVLNELGNVVETELEYNWLGGLLGITTLELGLSLSLESGLLFLLCLWLIFSEQFKKLTCYRNINYKYC